ncbi:PREDICTED: non-canonical poly(A) RNA polymerase PAPD5 [Nelumbo nucifera]|uniref:polynucleotide adenylyltransferase n=1 Tax=Nelumbo nucifera TaxID=4432 RepID=A0A1U7YXV5_NELNU|nr:PREDICTED: non-canonical poly(A) RNA polymerase PAPD5 [Nelumbo nucifera]
MEIDGFVYETLGSLSASTVPSTDFSGPDSPEPYSVFRTQITSSSLNCHSPETAAPDYFSLDVEDVDADVVDGSRQPTAATPPVATPTSSRPVDRTLEVGWFRANKRFRSPMIQLHKEILDFCSFLSPTPEEQASRNTAVECVFDVIKYIWPHCKVEVFGSFKTGLYLPTSDIDVVILESKVKTPQIGLKALSRALSQRGIAKQIQVIAKARVPIIKFVERKSGISFDISFDVENGPKAAEFIKDAVTKLPPLRPLCLILKVFLQQRELNEVYSGGIGSYALLAMLMAHLQGFQDGRASVEHNLGVLLVNFFDFYGHKLNTCDVGISCKAGGTFFLKSNKGFFNTNRPFLLSIEDPQAPDNDIGKNSFNYSQIRSAFAMAFSILTNAKTILNLGPNRSILGTIIRSDPVLLERRGGCNGEVTFNSLLPGAGEPLQPQFMNEQEILCNWQLDDEDPLPRGNGIFGEDSGSYSSRERKALKERLRSQVKENGEVVNFRHEENGSRKDKTPKKKRWRNHPDGSNGYGASSTSRRYIGGSPWGRSC